MGGLSFQYLHINEEDSEKSMNCSFVMQIKYMYRDFIFLFAWLGILFCSMNYTDNHHMQIWTCSNFHLMDYVWMNNLVAFILISSWSAYKDGCFHTFKFFIFIFLFLNIIHLYTELKYYKFIHKNYLSKHNISCLNVTIVLSENYLYYLMWHWKDYFNSS